MFWNRCIAAACVALFLGGCATALTPPNTEERSALAPTGTLRAGILVTTSLQVTKDSASGELKGVSIDLAKELARRMNVPFTPVSYSSITALMEGEKSAQWDVAFLAVDASREKDVDYAAPYMEVEIGLLVLPGSKIKSVADADRPGNKIGVTNKGGPDLFLTHRLKRAELVRGYDLPVVMEMLKFGKADAVAANKPTLFAEAQRQPGSRVLEGRFSVVPYAMATLNGRSAGNDYVRKFLDEIKASGLMKTYIDNAGLQGVVVAPRQ